MLNHIVITKDNQECLIVELFRESMYICLFQDGKYGNLFVNNIKEVKHKASEEEIMLYRDRTTNQYNYYALPGWHIGIKRDYLKSIGLNVDANSNNEDNNF